MEVKYPHILSPIRVGGIVLKNRLVSGNSLPHFLQGPESFPAEPVINHVVTMAKNGAAVVTFADWTVQRGRPPVSHVYSGFRPQRGELCLSAGGSGALL